MTRVFALLVTILIGASAASCARGGDAPPMKELQRAKSGDLTVVLLAKNDALKPGKDEAVLEFRNAANALVDVGTVKVNATMPMAGMAPMMGSIFIKPADAAGRYAIESDLGMAGTWQLAIEWSGPAGRGKVNLSGPVR